MAPIASATERGIYGIELIGYKSEVSLEDPDYQSELSALHEILELLMEKKDVLNHQPIKSMKFDYLKDSKSLRLMSLNQKGDIHYQGLVNQLFDLPGKIFVTKSDGKIWFTIRGNALMNLAVHCQFTTSPDDHLCCQQQLKRLRDYIWAVEQLDRYKELIDFLSKTYWGGYHVFKISSPVIKITFDSIQIHSGDHFISCDGDRDRIFPRLICLTKGLIYNDQELAQLISILAKKPEPVAKPVDIFFRDTTPFELAIKLRELQYQIDNYDYNLDPEQSLNKLARKLMEQTFK